MIDQVKGFVLLDHDGVLVDTEPWYFEAGRQALAQVGVQLDLQQYLADMAQGLGTWTQAEAAGVDEPTLERLRQVRNVLYQGFLQHEQIEIPGVIEVLQELSQRARLAIVTTAKPADFDLIHRDRHLVDHVEFVLTRADCVRAKPHPEPYLTALARFGATAEQALVVEDSARGLRAAVAAGIDCAVVDNPFTRGQDFTGARHRIDSLNQVLDLVRS